MTRYMVWAFCLILTPVLLAKEYDLNGILALAEQHNKDIRLARADLKTASAEKLDAFSSALPKIDLVGNYNRNLQENVIFFTQDFTTGENLANPIKIPVSFNNEYALNAVLSQTLFSFKVGFAIQASRYLNKLTENSFEATRQQVVTRVKTSFYQTLLLQKVMEVAADAESSAASNYDNQKIKFDGGTISEFELLQAEVRWQNSIPETIRARQQYQASLNNLKALVGIPVSEALALNGNLENFPEMPAKQDLEAVMAARPDFNALMWEKKLRQKNVSAQRAEFLPTVDGSITYTYGAQSDQFKLEQENDNIILGVSVNVPIFSGGSRIAGLRRASAEVDRVETRIAQAEDNIQVQIENVYLELQESLQRIQASQKAVESARRAFEIAETRSQNGLSTQVELKDSRVALDQAQLGYYSAIFDYLASYFSWEIAIGEVRNGF